MLSRFQAPAIVFILLAYGTAFGEEIRDYYSEPGLNPFKDEMRDLNEAIDPFSGTLQQKYVDLHLPGNGGLDITVNRIYTSRQDSSVFGTRGYTGLGWTMHFGRIVVPSAHRDKICSQQTWNVHTQDNPSIEFSDGGREMLVLSDFHADETLITKTNWKADCQGVSSGMRVTAPDGKIYYMDEEEFTQNEYSWYTTRIEDLDGNWVNVGYQTSAVGIKYIDQITSSDGRTVDFSYLSVDSNTIRLDTISANNQVWEYHYSSISNSPYGHQQLTGVTRPDQLSWNYTYYPQLSTEVGGSHSLESVTYPHGGRIEYTYQLVRFEPTSSYETTAVATKATSGPGITAEGNWTYEFVPSTQIGDPDQTIVTTPDGRIEYDHQGYVSGGALVWPIGLLHQKRVYEDGVLAEAITNDWGTRQISVENYWHGRDAGRMDNETLAPVLNWSHHSRFSNGSGIQTTYLDYDIYGNPRQVIEECSLVDCSDRVTDVTYINDTTRWLIGLKEDETIAGVGTISRSYYPDTGRLQSISEYGVMTNYTYTSQGDLETETNARNFTKNYFDYYRGIARHEEHETEPGVFLQIDRAVNPTGTVHSLTNGERHTTVFGYNGLNQLTSIQFPININVSIDYTLGRKTLTRGNYQERTTLNGFGRSVLFEREDTTLGEIVSTTTRYDALGRTEFTSYPNSTLGTTYVYDVLGRKRRITHGNGTFRTIEYDIFENIAGDMYADTRITDERNFVTTSLSLYYGSYNRSLGVINLGTPENGTFIRRNILGAPTQVTQGRWDESTNSLYESSTRSYFYDARQFLDYEVNPETGTTDYGRDEVGNKVSTQVGSSPQTTFSYDGLNRLTYVDYPTGTPDVSLGYDDNSNVTSVTKDLTSWTYGYDENDNLTDETLTINESVPERFHFQYTLDGMDYVEALIYPDGVEVGYSPSALGRVTTAGSYASNINYHPNGLLASIQYANGTTSAIALNDIQLVERIRSGFSQADDIVNLEYQYDDAQNVRNILDHNNTTNNIMLDYDGINRLTVADGSWGTGSIDYTNTGNIREYVLGNATLTYTYNSTTQKLQQVYDSSQSAAYPYSHDVYGNVTRNHLRTFRYDDASNLVEVGTGNNPLSDAIYEYDGNDYRVKEKRYGFAKYSVYSKGGDLLYERDLGACEDTKHIYVGKASIAKDVLPSVDDDNGNGIVDCLEFDADDDGLTAQEESALGTDANNPDSDSDGIPDGYEQSNGLNPLVDDASGDLDGDGVGNIEEYLDGTDPNDAASYNNASPVANDDVTHLELNPQRMPNAQTGIFSWSTPPLDLIDPPHTDPARNVSVVHFLDGTSLLVWISDADRAIYAQRFNQQDTPYGGLYIVNEDPIALGAAPSVAQLNNGNVVIIWRTDGSQEIMGRIVDSSGVFLGNAFTVSGNTGVGVQKPDVIGTSSGGFVAAWQTYLIAGAQSGIYLRKFDATGLPTTDTVAARLLQSGAGSSGVKVVEMIDNGYAVTWKQGTSILLRWFDNNLSALGNHVFVNTSASGVSEGEPSIARASDGGMLIAWEGRGSGTNSTETEVFARYFNVYRTPSNEAFQINTESYGRQAYPTAAADGRGFVVYWTSGRYPSTFDLSEIRSQRFDENMGTIGAEQWLAKGLYLDYTPLRVSTYRNSGHLLVAKQSLIRTGSTAVDTNTTIDVLANDLDLDPSDTPSNAVLSTATIIEGSGTVTIQNNRLVYDTNSSYDSLPSGSKAVVRIEYTMTDDSGAASTAYVDVHIARSSTVFIDDFESDMGWITDPHGTDIGAQGRWERGVPSAVTFGIPLQLSNVISGQNALVTGLSSSVHNNVEVRTSVLSPAIALPGADTVELLASYYFACRAGDPSDRLQILVREGTSEDVLYSESCPPDEDGFRNQSAEWRSVKLDLTEYRGRTIQIKLIADDLADADQVESAFDDVRILALDYLGSQPTISILSPQEGAEIPQGNTVTLSASATDTEDGDISASISWYSDIDGYLGTGASLSISTLSTNAHIVTARVVDSHGRITTASINISVVAPDTIPPVVTPPSGITTEATALQTPVNLGSASANDNVDGALTPTPDQTGPFDVGTHTITWSATDAAGNTGTATQSVTVQDTTAPVLVAPADVNVTLTPPATVALGTATATDIFNVTITNDAPTTFPAGTTVVTWTATDTNGNTSTDIQNVTVTAPADTTPPVVTPPADIVTEAIALQSPVTLGAGSANDDVDGILTPIPDQTGPFSLGTHTITWSATDAAGNTGTAIQTVTVQDTTAPVLAVPEDVNVTATPPATVALGTATATDIFSVTITNDALTTFPAGTTVVTWTATDANGNSSTDTQNVTVTAPADTTPPVITPPANITVEATALQTTVALGTASANDDVDGALTPTPDQTGPFGVGTHTITWSATDAAGNTGTATQTVTVRDTTVPILTVPADVNVTATPPATVALGTATATDIFSVTVTNDAPATFPAGTTMVTWTATDVNGNSSTDTQSVTVTAPADTTPPVVTPPADIVTEAIALQSPVTLGAASANDDVDGALTPTPDQTGPFSLGTHTITWSATDAAGNTGIATQNVTVQDTTAPVLAVPADVTVTAAAPATVDIGTATTTDIFSVTVTNDALATFPAGTTIVSWTATDANGNSSTDTQNVTVNEPPPGNNITGTSGSDFLEGTAGNDIINGEGGDDNLLGHGGDDTLNGGDGNDWHDGGPGADVMTGGLGDDTYYVDDAGDQVIEQAGEGNDEVQSEVSFTLTEALEQLNLQGSANVDGTGNSQGNWLDGNSGDNTLNGLGGDDQLIGREGDDTLNGGDGNDWHDGGPGADVMTGGLGDDSYYVDDAGDQVIEQAGEGNDEVQSEVNFTLTEGLEQLNLQGTASVDGTGNSQGNWLDGNSGDNTLSGLDGDDELLGREGNDTLIGGEGNDWLDSGGGADTLIGGPGDDTYYIDDVGDQVTEQAGEGTDQVESEITYTLAEALEHLILQGTSAIDGTGNSQANWIEGNDANNTLSGMEGDDSLLGRDGADTLNGGNGNDWLDGGSGADTLTGGAGDDTYYLDDPGDQVIEQANAGADEVQSEATHTLGEHLERLRLQGNAPADGTGNAQNNWMRGSEVTNTLNGLAGDDELIARGGNDTLIGGPGNDWLDGGLGNDTYQLEAGHGQDTIGEESEAGSDDRLIYSGNLDRYDLWFHRNGNHLVVTWLNSTDQVTIESWFTDPDRQVERVQTPDAELFNTNVQGLVDAMAPYGPPVNGVVNLTSTEQQTINTAIDAAWQ